MVLLATAIRLILASVAAYLLEYLDDTLKTTEDINRITKLPVIGYIADVKREDYEGVYVARKPRSIVAEEFRALRTNISFAEVDERIKPFT